MEATTLVQSALPSPNSTSFYLSNIMIWNYLFSLIASSRRCWKKVKLGEATLDFEESVVGNMKRCRPSGERFHSTVRTQDIIVLFIIFSDDIQGRAGVSPSRRKIRLGLQE